MLGIISIAIFLFIGFIMIFIIIGGNQKKTKEEIEIELREQNKYLKEYQEKINKRKNERKRFLNKLWKKIFIL